MHKAVYIGDVIKFLKWVGEWMFAIFILIPLVLVYLYLWKNEMEDND